MSEHNINVFSDKKIEIDKITWNAKHRSVRGSIVTTVRFDLEDVMHLIIEEWNSFDRDVRIEFARRIKALDDNDAKSEIASKKDEEDEEEFRW